MSTEPLTEISASHLKKMPAIIDLPGIPRAFYREFLPSRNLEEIDEALLARVFYALEGGKTPPAPRTRALELHKLAKSSYYLEQHPVVSFLMQLYAAKTFDFYPLTSGLAHLRMPEDLNLALSHGRDLSDASFAYDRAAYQAGKMEMPGLEVRCLIDSISRRSMLIKLGEKFHFEDYQTKLNFTKHQDLLPGDIHYALARLTYLYHCFSAVDLGYTQSKWENPKMKQQNAN